MDNFDVKFEETLSDFNTQLSETDNSFNTQGDSVIVIPQGGECTIKSISVNGTNVKPDKDKNVNIVLPTKTSDLENDSDFAKSTDIPTKVSELENDKNFQENVIEKITVNGTEVKPTDKTVNITVSSGQGGTIDNFVKVTQTLNSLEVGDTIFKGDTIQFNIDISELKDYFDTYTPKITHLYFVNKDTNDGFRFDCYITKLNALQYKLTIQINFLENENISLIHEESETISFNYLGSFPSTYSIPNIYKDITNLYIYYTSSDISLIGNHEGTIGGITAQKVGGQQDTLVNSQNGVETPINHYVKVKEDRLVQVVGNKETPIPINEETTEKDDKSCVVDIKQFIFEGDNWIHEKTLKSTILSTEDKSSYIARSAVNNDLYYYTYRDIHSNVDFDIASSYFEEKTIKGKTVYTSSKQSYNRDATALQLDKRPLDISSVSFDLYMQGLGATNRYYPEIAFVVDEGNKIAVEVQFSCYDKGFELKALRRNYQDNPNTYSSKTIVKQLPTINNIFDANVRIEIKNSVITAYLNNEDKAIGSANISDICPELVDYTNVQYINFGLRYDITPPTDWGGFSNVVFEKKYWEQGYKIQDNTLYVNLAENSLYRYTEDTTTKPYPNFIPLTANNTSSVSELVLAGQAVVNSNVNIPYNLRVDIDMLLTRNDLIYVEIGNGIEYIGNLNSFKEIIGGFYMLDDYANLDKYIVSVRPNGDKWYIDFTLSQKGYDGWVGIVKVYVQKNALKFI